MVIRERNYAFKTLPAQVPSGAIIERCNLSQLTPNTPLPQQASVYRNCNLMNCNPGSVPAENCMLSQVALCAHLHPELPLPAEPVECPHVKVKTEIYADNELVDTVYEYEDVIL